MEPHKGISRIVSDASRTKGWKVSIMRASGVANRLFSDGVHGGSDKAYRAACAWYESILAQLPLATRIGKMAKLRRNNRSGVSGVYRWPASGEDSSGAYWAAQCAITPLQKPVRRKFSIAFYGELQAKELAIKARNEFLQRSS